MDASAQDVQRATQMLISQSIPQSDAEAIVRRYAKEARRLTIDLRQERERKLLDVRHRMESELSDVVQSEDEWDRINQFVEQAMPTVYSISGAIGVLPSPPSGSPANVFINPRIIGTVNGIVTSTMNGDQNYGPSANELLSFIEAFGGSNRLSLTSDLQELEDEGAKSERRLAAKGRLLAFAGKISGKIGEVSLNIIQSYIESKLGL